MRKIKIFIIVITVLSFLFLVNNCLVYFNLKKENKKLMNNYKVYNEYKEKINVYDNINKNYKDLVSNNLSLEETKNELDKKIINLNKELNMYNSKIKELKNIK